MSLSATTKTRRALHDFTASLNRHGHTDLRRAPMQELQVNVGRLCNQACNHCHVDAGPKRTEIMTWETMTKILAWIEHSPVRKVDITGGAPEVNPNFRRFVDALLTLGCTITSRCNLTVLFEPGQEDLAYWYAHRHVRLVCSMPCYTKENVDAQRGQGVFDKSIAALKQLNTVGYGREPSLALDLIYNPGGAFLPGAQAQLEADYKKQLGDNYGIQFDRLLTLANLPINRFRHWLEREGKLDDYQQLLHDNFNAATVPGLMCRHLVSVDWLGKVYDCDFNQMLDLPLAGKARYLWDIDAGSLPGKPIAVGAHCFGCTAGSGSSCGGALVG